MQIQKNILVSGCEGKPIATDLFYIADGKPKPIIIYVHGFNGFKDWGNFDIIAKQFATAGFVFIKFNLSHNGTTPEQPEDFADLEAYGENNYTKELFDLQQVINWCSDGNNPHSKQMDASKLYLVGHSRGGGIVLLKAAEESKAKTVTTWASVSECKTPWGSWNDQKMKEWKETGVQYYLNSRTRQQMPLYYQLFEDYQQNVDRLDIKKAISSLHIPILLCHGTKDEAVPVSKAYELKEANPSAELFLVDSDHVFGRKHPWTEKGLPDPMQQVVDKTIRFFQQC